MARKSAWRQLNDAHGEKTDAAFQREFGVELTTGWSLLAGASVSYRADDQPFTAEQAAWLKAYSDGYADAMNAVSAEAK